LPLRDRELDLHDGRMRVLILLSSALVLSPLPSAARTIEGVSVPESIRVDGAALKLNGSALREATILGIDVYVISLYRLNTTRQSDAVLACDEPLVLTKRFMRDVDASDMLPPWKEAVARRARKLGIDVRRSTRAMLRGIGDTREGQVMGFTWRPGKGLEVSLDGKVTARVADPRPEFCRVVYAGYVGGMANEPDIAKALVGG